MPAALDVDWPTIRRLAESGVAPSQLAKDYGVDANAIKKRSSREEWSTPNRIKVKVKAIQATSPACTLLSTGLKNAALAYQIDSLQAIKQAHPLSIAQYLAKKVSTALEGDMLPDVTSYDRLDVADKMIRRAVGLDAKSQVNVNIGVFAPESMWSAPESDKSSLDQSSTAPTFEAITEIVSDGPED